MQTNPLKGFLSIVSTKFGGLILSILITPLLVRLLGSSDYGDYAFILSIISMAMILINAGINDSIRKFVAEDRSVPNWSNNVFGFYTRLGISLAVLGSIFFISINIFGITNIIFGNIFELYFYFVIFVIMGRVLHNITRSALMGKGLEYLSEPLKVVKQALFGIAAVSLAYLGYGVIGALIGHIVAVSVVTAISLYYVSKVYDMGTIFSRTPDGFPTMELATFNIQSIVLVFLVTSLYNVDILLLRPITGSTQTGYYKSALVIAEFMWFVPFALQTALLHSTSELWSKNDLSTITMIATKSTRYVMNFTLLLVMGVAALADLFLPLYFGSEFTAAIQPLWLLLPGALGFATARPIIAIGQGKGDLRPLILATGMASIINFILNIVLIPIFGMSGAAISTSIGYGSMLVFHGITARKLGYDPFADLRIVRTISTAALSGIVIFGLSILLGNWLISLIVIPSAGFIVYFSLALMFGVVATDDVITLIKSFQPPLSEKAIYYIKIIPKLK